MEYGTWHVGHVTRDIGCGALAVDMGQGVWDSVCGTWDLEHEILDMSHWTSDM